MTFILVLLSILLVLDCLLLILLVLVQLPKKEAGAGIAFGGAAADALFGAGTGNVLTKITKYAAGVFFALLLLIGLAQGRVFKKDAKGFIERADQQAGKTSEPAAPLVPATTPAAAPIVTNLLTTTAESLTNAPAATATNPAPAPQ
jgi:preprotein translocase subunit SecG